MPSSFDDTPNLPEDTSRKHPQHTERVGVARGVNILPPLGEHAASRAIHNLSSTAREVEVLRHNRDSGKPCGASDHQGADTVEDTGGTHRDRPNSKPNGVDEHGQAEEGDGVYLKKRKPPDGTTGHECKRSTDVNPNFQPERDGSNPEKAPKSGLKSLLERARVLSYFFPRTTIKARVSGGVRKFLLMDSGAQVLPLTASRIDTENKNCSQHLHGHEKNTVGLSPLPSSRKRPICDVESPEKDKQTFFSGSSVDVDVDVEEYTRKITEGCGQVGPTQTKTAPSNRILPTSAYERRFTSGEAAERAIETITSSGGDRHNTTRVDDAATMAQDERDGTIFDSPDVKEFDASLMSLGRSTIDRVTEEDFKRNHPEQWPEPLDEEPVAANWALDKSEGEVFAVAKRSGSVLVRVVTWNMHAKPTPGAEELRETLLPPGKFHIYAIGTQECQNSIAKSVIVHSKKEWEDVLKETLGNSYEMLCGHALQAIHNAVFVHRGLIPLLRNVRSSAVATGLSLGTLETTLGNKGGVAISFVLGSTSCIFVNSHLAAHQTNVRQRNNDFFRISEGLALTLGPRSTKASSSPANLASASNLGTTNDHNATTEDDDGRAASDTTCALRPDALAPGSTRKCVVDSLEVCREKAEEYPAVGEKMKRKTSHVGLKEPEPQWSQPPMDETRPRSGRKLAGTDKVDKDILVPRKVESNPIGPPLNLSEKAEEFPAVGEKMKRKTSHVGLKEPGPQRSQPPSKERRPRSRRKVAVTEEIDKDILVPRKVESNPIGPPPNLSEKAEELPVVGGKMKRKTSDVGLKEPEPQRSQPPSNKTRPRSGRKVAVTEKIYKDMLVPRKVESNPIGPPPNLSFIGSSSDLTPTSTPSAICGDEPQRLREIVKRQQREIRGEKRGKTLPEVFDRVVWSGDLNYRVNVPRKIADVLLSNNLHEVLLKNDQLSLERERGGGSAPFRGYREGPLNFRPTYKFDSGTDRYDTSPKQRVPAWTDRVLFSGAAPGLAEKGNDDKSLITAATGEPSERMHLKAYRSVMELQTSDHRPVVASFVMEFDQPEGGVSDSSEGAVILNQTSSEVCLIA